ncbi:putative alpha-l-rhamnosidase protein-1 [Coleophoma cylindrospora]|uniref:Putative alpha-l-rhamnosidase protein-1 n=1 Tax=Coleophoma cylindrospora TaxID=1849047 RepID=A0A3D8RM13_9HELO|nr:putative alpha-l-rhamnosidase protein-1 [Coleophoma cylindrospora]
MLFPHLLTSLATTSLLGFATAQTCWKNTTCSGPIDTAFPGSWETNIYAPSSRTVSPKSVLSLATREVISSYPGPSLLSSNGSTYVFDFGIEVGGLVTVKYSTTGPGSLGLAFTEAKTYIGQWSDSSNGKFAGPDGALYSNFTSAGNYSYTMPDLSLRGGFRYLSLFLLTNGSTSLNIQDISLNIGFAPTWSNLRAYQGYFHCSDETLNKIWYSGAYTLQTNAVPVGTGRHVPFLTTGWANNGTLGPGDTIIVDGAKRDRAVWPGDMGIAVPSSFVSVGDLDSVKNALQVMYNYQNSDGSFPEAGPPLLQQGSDTYHMWSMIGTYNYVLYSNDTTFLAQNWAKYLKAMNYIYGKVGTSGLLNVTGIRDWARWQQGFNNSEANIILYHTLNTGADLATWVGDTTNLSSTYIARATTLKTAIQTYCYDSAYGAFKDNATATSLHPQDANSMALLFGITSANSTQAQSISSNLLKNWTPIGAETPELPGNISPFISSFEIQGHLTIGQTDRALELIRRSWGWYLTNPNGSESTVIEGYLTNGSFGYRSSRGYSYDTSYVSHSHGWSSGPTSALTNFILGLSVTSPAGGTWKLAPQFGDLTSAEGGFVTSLGKYRAQWIKSGKEYYTLNVQTPESTTGALVLPSWAGKVLKVDGKTVSKGRGKAVGGGEQVTLTVKGGNHTVVMG